MRFLLSPAKTFRKEQLPVDAGASQPLFSEQAGALMQKLAQLSPKKLEKLMDISAPLAEETAKRHLDWGGPFHPGNARTAVHAFHGEVYRALGADRWNASDLDHAQEKLRILSGLYGLLRPLDLIQEYRLEMGTRWSPTSSDSLYSFWGSMLSQQLVSEGDGPVINLASQEYFKVLDHADSGLEVIHIHFKERRGEQYKMIGTYAKTARGRMARFLIQERIESPSDIRKFAEGGYQFNPDFSTPEALTFTRENPIS
jgi:cytoplasmic iron level regulating protein YaaA (DUF328/UPF0246 family)